MDEEQNDEQILEGEESAATSGATPLEYPTLFIPKEGDYQLPESGRGMVDFKKISEDDAGCTIQVTAFEPESNDVEVTEEMDAEDHADAFINSQRSPASAPTSMGDY